MDDEIPMLMIRDEYEFQKYVVFICGAWVCVLLIL